MSSRFAELAWSPTPMGEVSLRRREDPVSGVTVFEVKLGDDFLMSSLFTVAEVELARQALARCPGPALDVAVGGLGLGYTAEAVLADPRVRELVVVDALEPVIDWHRRGLVPLGTVLLADPRCRVVHADFFALNDDAGFDPARPDRLFDAVIVDIDHSPRHRLTGATASIPSAVDFYGVEGVRRLAGHLEPGGVFALWSNDPPDDGYLDVLRAVFVDVVAEIVRFPNPLQDTEATNTVYLALRPDGVAASSPQSRVGPW